jgi:hypothetical protein
MKYLLALLITLITLPVFGQLRSKRMSDPEFQFMKNCMGCKYKVNKEKIIGWSTIFLGAAFDGFLKGSDDHGRDFFEKQWGAAPLSYLGSKAYLNYYTNPSWWNKTFGNPNVWNALDDGRKAFYITGGIVVGIGGYKDNCKWWHYGIDFGVSILGSILFKGAFYEFAAKY